MTTLTRGNLHLVVEYFGFTGSSGRNEVLVEDVEDIFTDLGEFGFDLLSVSLDHRNLCLVTLRLLLLLD
jgi:hypothetical protein